MEKRSEMALIALRRILRATEFNARTLSRASGLTPSQLMALQFVHHYGETTPSEMAKHASLTQATITALMDKLEQRKLIKRRRDALDGRRILVRLTKSGEKTLDQTPDALQMLFSERFEALKGWEKSLIVAALERVAALLGAEDIDAAPVLDVGAIDKPLREESE